jgi:hypothetical protein
MKLLLSCEDVFEALTNGCDVAAADEAIAEHLDCCADCRQLAEAAAPATEVFRRAMPSDGELRQTSTALANAVLARLASEQTAVHAASHRRSFLALNAYAWSQLGAAAAVLLAVGGLFWAASPGDTSGRSNLAALPAFATPLAGATEPAEYGFLQLASLRLQEKCLTMPKTSPAAVALYECCTRCHHAGDMVPEVRLVAFSQQTCAACHRS